MLSLLKGSGGSGTSNGSTNGGKVLRKTIMVGPSYQVKVPREFEPCKEEAKFDENDLQLWDPYLISGTLVDMYLRKSETIQHQKKLTAMATGVKVKCYGEEQLLYLLLKCDYNVDEALRRLTLV